jgi:hypothetical protein
MMSCRAQTIEGGGALHLSCDQDETEDTESADREAGTWCAVAVARLKAAVKLYPGVERP